MFKMAAISLDAHYDSFDYRKCNLGKDCSIENSLKYFILLSPTCVHTPRFSYNPKHGNLAD